MWTYGVELWGTASNSNMSIIQHIQNKILTDMMNFPWIPKMHELYTYTGFLYIAEQIERRKEVSSIGKDWRFIQTLWLLTY